MLNKSKESQRQQGPYKCLKKEHFSKLSDLAKDDTKYDHNFHEN